MAQTNEAISYLRKLQRIITKDADFTFFSIKLIKKEKVDDLLCCYLASLPDAYKKIMKTSGATDLKSVVSYKMLMLNLKRRFSLSSSVYLVKHKIALNCIGAIIATLEKDIRFIENSLS